jgi:two-component system, NtrC family, sensor kinase
MEKYLTQIINGISNASGDDFFHAIALQLNEIVEADYTFITHINHQSYSAQTLVMVAKGKIVDNFEYSLTNTPCAEVAKNTLCYHPQDVCKLFPKDQLLIDMKIEAFIGIPLLDKTGKVMGQIATMFEHVINKEGLALTLFQLFSGRIAAELQSLEHEHQLQLVNQNLEQILASRTAELQATQQQLVESEKMALLGNLVAGIAHEVNTPLGIAITTHSIISEEFSNLFEKLETGHLSTSIFKGLKEKIIQSLLVENRNLQRAKELIENFKHTAADQNMTALETIDIKEYYLQIISTLSPLLEKNQVVVELDMPEGLLINTYPGVHVQVLTNLITNSVRHGFSEITHRQIHIKLAVLNDALYQVDYSDNGCGLSAEGRARIFEPFYTTARHLGGTGLGMSIVYNLVTQKLEGQIQLAPESAGSGFQLSYSFRHFI